MKLSGATVTRIEEELVRLYNNSTISWKTKKGKTVTVRRSWGERHRAIEDFIQVLVEEMKVHEQWHGRQAERNASRAAQAAT